MIEFSPQKLNYRAVKGTKMEMLAVNHYGTFPAAQFVISL